MFEAVTGTQTTLALRLLGEPEARIGGVPAPIANRKLLCMLGYLSLVPGCRETRERLVGLLWSESDERRARGSLRQAAAAFRRICGETGFEGFETDRGCIGLTPGLVETDLAEVLARLDPIDLHPALLEVDDLPARLLRGCEDCDPALAAWLTVQRETLRERLLRELDGRLSRLPPGAPGEAAAARAMLRLDPTQEAAARRLMEARATAGDVAGALRVYNNLYRLLDEEHDMEPAPRTQALVARIKCGELEQPAPQPEPEAAPPARAPLLLIEPFVMERGDARDRLLLDGFRRRLIANLVRFREWRVAEGLENDPPPVSGPEGADRFRVRATAEAAEEGMALTVSIVEEGTGVFVWSDRFTLDRESWFDRQARLLRHVTVSLNLNLSADRMRRMAALPRLKPSLHDHWLRGQRLIGRYEPGPWEEAERLFRQVTRAAPDFAPAWSSLANLGNTRHVAYPGVMRSAAQHWRTLALAQRAVELDPLDSRAQATLGWCLLFCGRWEAAFVNLDLALELNAHDPWTATSVAAARAFAGRRGAAEALADSVLDTAEMSETRRWSLLAGLRFICGDAEGTLEAASRAGQVRVNVGAWRAAALAQLGRTDEARREAERLRADLRARWRGDGPAEPEAMTLWLLHMFPIRREVDWRRFRDGLARAGMPTNHVDFGYLPP